MWYCFHAPSSPRGDNGLETLLVSAYVTDQTTDSLTVPSYDAQTITIVLACKLRACENEEELNGEHKK